MLSSRETSSECSGGEGAGANSSWATHVRGVLGYHVRGCRHPRRLCGAVAPLAVAVFGAPLRLAAPIRSQRPTTLVHLLEAASGGTLCIEGRAANFSRLALAEAALGGGPCTAFGALTLGSHGVSVSNRNATDSQA